MTPAAQQFLSRLAEMDPEDMVDLRFGYKAKLTQTSSFKASVAQEAIDYYRTPVNTTGAGKAFERPREYCYSPCAVCDSGSDAHVEPKQGVNYRVEDTHLPKRIRHAQMDQHISYDPNETINS
jgi:hypothetical protein